MNIYKIQINGFVSFGELDYFCSCATSTKNIDEEDARKCVFATDKKVVKTHFF
jgi:hypothetical protein